MNACKYSVLMSVQEKDDPSYLVAAIENMRSQEIPPQEYVIMVDGAVTEELRFVLSEYEKDRDLFTVIWLNDDNTLDKALKIGFVENESDGINQREKTLLGTWISDAVLAHVNRVAESKRINAKQKQAEGIAAAKEKGIKFGRPQVPLPDNFYEVQQQWKEKKLTLRQAAKACGMALTTFYDKAKAVEKG